MKKNAYAQSLVRSHLINLMADHAFHSGEALGQALGISRAAVWKHIQSLQTLGLQFYSVRGRGYRLVTPIELLDADKIKQHGDISNSSIHIDILDEVDSTNSFLLNALKENNFRQQACFAEYQTLGRGRRGRQWLTPYGAALAFSLNWQFQCSINQIGGLSLAVGLAVTRRLEYLGVQGVKLKWPNDLVWNGRKLGGILIEISGDAAGPYHVVIGIGLNMAVPAKDMQTIEQPWVDLLHVMSGSIPSRNQVAGQLLQSVLEMLPVFEKQGFSAFTHDWQSRDALVGREIKIIDTNNTLSGIAAGVNDKGELLIQSESGCEAVMSGEVSVRTI